MNVTEISLNGPVMEGLCEVRIADEHDNDSFTLDNSDVEAARADGQEALLNLVLDNAGRGVDILKAAAGNETTVLLEGENVSPDVLRDALAEPSAPGV